MAVPDPLDLTDDDGLFHANGIDALTGLPAAPAVAPEDAIGPEPPRPGHCGEGPIEKFWDFTKKLHGLPEDLEGGQRPGLGGLGGRLCRRHAGRGPRRPRATDRPPPGLHEVPAGIAQSLGLRARPSLDDWLRKLGAHRRRRADPLPYYVMFVGGPESIPFEHQSVLDVHMPSAGSPSTAPKTTGAMPRA